MIGLFTEFIWVCVCIRYNIYYFIYIVKGSFYKKPTLQLCRRVNKKSVINVHWHKFFKSLFFNIWKIALGESWNHTSLSLVDWSDVNLPSGMNEAGCTFAWGSLTSKPVFQYVKTLILFFFLNSFPWIIKSLWDCHKTVFLMSLKKGQGALAMSSKSLEKVYTLWPSYSPSGNIL